MSEKMFVKHLAFEDGDSFELLTDPEWAPIAKAIQGLDGEQHTLVSFESAGKDHMIVGGGPDLCVVYATSDNETFHWIIDPSKGSAQVELKVGQQTSLYPENTMVAKAVALKASKLFAEKGKLDPSAQWKTEGSQEEAQE